MNYPHTAAHISKYQKAFLSIVICMLIPAIWNVVLAETGEAGQAADEIFWFWSFLGRLHPLIVHFPVSLLVIAAFMELGTLKKFQAGLRPGIYLLVIIGAFSAVFAVIFGWILAGIEDYGGSMLAIHRWTGLATALLGIIAALLLYLILKKQQYQLIKAYRAVLFVSVAGITIAGHYGASLTHGQDYLLSVTPWAAPIDHDNGMAAGPVEGVDIASFASDTGSLTVEQEVKLNLEARTILAHNCFKCHNGDKTEGKLRLDKKEFVFKGGESGPVIVPGEAGKSELIRRITLPAGHKEAMPGKGKPLTKKDIDLLALWINKGAPWPDQAAKGVFRVAALAPRKPDLPAATAQHENPIDRWVDQYFKKKKISWKTVVDDKTFLRRVYLDIVGTPPTSEELRAFIANGDPDKRSRIAAQLLSRNDDYAMHWMTFWNDLLRNDYTGTGYITGGRFNISDWLYQSLLQNKPYNQFVSELLAPSEASKGFIRGIQWRGTVNSSQTTAMQAAQNVSQAMLGLNLKCASCHDSFISDWKLDDAYAFANIFSDTTLEINRCDIPTGKMADTRLLWPELGPIAKEANSKEKSEQLALNLTKPENGRLYRTLVNRVWSQLFGRGIVAPVDEMDNEPWSQDLLDWLAADFVEQGYDIKKLIYLITSSTTYQLPSAAIADANQINRPDFIFSGMLKRKLTAEQFADAVSSTVYPIYQDSALKYNPFGQTAIYNNKQAFVRASLVQNDLFLTAMGRPSRENVTSSRDGQSNLLQAMELTNGSLLNETLARGAQRWLASYKENDRIIREVYFQALGREPSAGEFSVAKQLLKENNSKEAVQDFLWAVVLLPEFQLIE